MSRTARCPRCGCTVFLPGRAAGFTFACRACGQKNRVIAGADGAQSLVAADAELPSVHPSLQQDSAAHRRVKLAVWILFLLSGLAFAGAYAGAATAGRSLTAGERLFGQAVGYAIAAVYLSLFLWARLGPRRAAVPALGAGLGLLAARVMLGAVALAAPDAPAAPRSVPFVANLGTELVCVAFALLLLSGWLSARRIRRDEALITRSEGAGR